MPKARRVRKIAQKDAGEILRELRQRLVGCEVRYLRFRDYKNGREIHTLVIEGTDPVTYIELDIEGRRGRVGAYGHRGRCVVCAKPYYALRRGYCSHECRSLRHLTQGSKAGKQKYYLTHRQELLENQRVYRKTGKWPRKK